MAAVVKQDWIGVFRTGIHNAFFANAKLLIKDYVKYLT
jgi:hypothetical protein